MKILLDALNIGMKTTEERVSKQRSPAKETRDKPWPGGSVRCGIVPNTKR